MINARTYMHSIKQCNSKFESNQLTQQFRLLLKSNYNWQLHAHHTECEMKGLRVRAKLNRPRVGLHTRMHLHYSKSFQFSSRRVIKDTMQRVTVRCSRYGPLYQYFHAAIIALCTLLHRILSCIPCKSRKRRTS